MASSRSLSLALAATTLAVSAASAQDVPRGKVHIELREQVAARHRQVRLGEVAFVHTTDLPTIQRLVELPIGQAPRPGSESVLERAALARWVRRQLGMPSDAVAWSGAERSRVTASTQILPAALVEQAGRDALARWLGPRSSRFDLESTYGGHDLALPIGQIELTARSLAAGAQPSARMTMWVDVAVDGAFTRTVPVSFRVEAYGEAWVVRSAVAPGAVLSPAMLERRQVDLASQAAAMQAASAPGEVPLRSLRALKPGELLSTRNAGHASAVNRGERVTLRLNAGGMQLESRAEALQEGEVGQVVKVKVTGASSTVEARVSGPGRVEAMP